MIAVLVYFEFFHNPVTAFVQSLSPDGMYRCTVTEKCMGMGEMQFEIVIDRRKLRTANASSFLIGEGWDNIYCDSYRSSCGNGNYSIVWEYNDRHLTTGLTIFSDSGDPPYWDGYTILKRPLTTYARGGFGTVVVEPPPKGGRPVPSGSTGGIFAP